MTSRDIMDCPPGLYEKRQIWLSIHRLKLHSMMVFHIGLCTNLRVCYRGMNRLLNSSNNFLNWSQYVDQYKDFTVGKESNSSSITGSI